MAELDELLSLKTAETGDGEPLPEEQQEETPPDKDNKDDFSKLSHEEALAKLRLMQRSLNRANRQAEKLRTSKKETPTKPESDDFSKEMLEQVRSSTAQEIEGKYKNIVARQAASAAFQAAGLTLSSDTAQRRNQLNRLVKLIDLEEISIDDRGDIEGLEDQIEDIKDQFPELFKAEKPRPARINGGERPVPPKKRSATELQVEAMFGG